jgi:hypothetical protein
MSHVTERTKMLVFTATPATARFSIPIHSRSRVSLWALLIAASLAAIVPAPSNARSLDRSLPRISGDYMRARARLLHLGYSPMKVVGENRGDFLCSDWKAAADCSRYSLPEGFCAVDISQCLMFWRAPNGRVVKIETAGDRRAGKVFLVEWASSDDLHDLTDSTPRQSKLNSTR